MQNYKKNFVTRTLAWVLTVVMVVTMLPMGVFAVVDLPDWSEQSTSTEKVDWNLPRNTKVIPAGMAGPNHLTNFGVSFMGHFIDENGRTVLKGRITQNQSVRGVDWKHIAFRFDDDLFGMIDFEKSYIMSGDKKSTSPFTRATFIGEKERIVPFETTTGSTQRDFFFVLNDTADWNKVVSNGGHVVQTRVYSDDAKKVWSKHSDVYKDPDAQVNYNTYTQSFSINNLIENRNDYVNGRIRSDSVGYVDSVASRSVFLPDQNKLRVIYQSTHGHIYSDTETEYKAFRQSFSHDLYKYLVKDKSGAIAHITIKDHAFNGYGTNPIPITLGDLNNSNNGDSIVVADSKFKKPDGLKVVRVPEGQAQNYIFSSGLTANPVVTIVEYNVDAKQIEEDLFKKGVTAVAFAFDSCYLEDGKPVSYFDYTTPSELNVPTGSTVEVLYNQKISGNHYDGHANVMFGDNKALDLIYGESNGKNVGAARAQGLKYIIDKGFRVPANTKISIVNLEDNLSVLKEVVFKITGPAGNEILNKRVQRDTSKIQKPEILRMSEILSSGIMNKTSAPVIDEIFTTNTKINGLIEDANIWVKTQYPDNTEENGFYYNNENTIPDGTADEQKHSISSDKTNKIASGKEYIGFDYEVDPMSFKNLTKDMPIKFNAKALSQVKSDDVFEQVQAKVHFDLNGRTSKIDRNPVIDKVAPLNKEYTHKLVEEKDPVSKDKVKKFVKNTDNYKPSGFAKIDKKTSEVVGAENLRVDKNKKTVKVTQNLKDAQGKDASVERTVINYLDHNDQPYAITSTNVKIKKDEINRLLMRQFPVNEEVNLPSSKRIVGWTTVKLTDKVEGGKLVTAAEQYYKILDSKDASNKANKIVRSIADWGKAENEAYVFDEASPIDKERTVYAVYDGLNIILHSNKTDNPDDDIIVRIPVDKSDLDYTNDVLAKLDATTAATLKEKNTPNNGEIIFKRMPSAPYTSNPSEIAKASPLLKDFAIDGKSFIGWSSVRFKNSEPTPGDTDPRFVAGTTQYNERVGKLIKGDIGTEQKPKTIPTRTEGYFSIKKDYQEFLLPNTFDFSFTPEDFKNENDEELNTFAEVIESGQDIHLYANYRDFFTVKVDPSYNVVKPADGTHEHGTYGPMTDNSKKQTLRIGLLHRTAVTDYNNPTVHPSANYYPVTSSQLADGNNNILQNWDPKAPTELTWKVVGYDDLGMRKSYVAVVVPEKPEDKEQVYNTFTKDKWKDLGIQTYIRLVGKTIIQDKKAPKNIFDVKSSDGWDKYGGQRAKTQTLKLERKVPGANPQDPEKTVTDTFTSATARQAVTVKRTVGQADLKETVGYNIKMANVLETLPTPEFEAISDKDNSVKLKWGSAEKEAGIEEITFSIGSDPEVTLKREGTSDTFKTDDNQYTATVIDGNLVINTGVLTGKGGKIARAKYHKMAGTEKVDSEEGTMLISTTKESEPVKDMNQNQKGKKDSEGKELPVKDSEGNPIINFQVPTKVTDQVGEGTKYIAQKWNPETQKWEEVGVTTIDEDANGKEKQIVLDKNKVNHDDIIRIVAKEKDPNGKYTDTEKEPSKNDGTAKLEDGYAKPAESTKVKVSWMEEDPQNQGKYIKVEEDFNPDHINDDSNPERQKAYKGLEDKQYVKLDLKAPTADLKATDSKYRRFIDIIGKINEMPYNQKVTIMIGATENSDENDPANIKEEFDTPEEAIKFLDSLLRKEQMPKIWVIAEDKFGNESQSEVIYEKNPIMTVEVFQAYRNRKYVKVRTDRANSTVTIKVMRGQDIYATGTVSGVGPDNFVNLEFKLVNGGNPYRLKTGDILSVEAKCTEGKITYTSNPLFIDIK